MKQEKESTTTIEDHPGLKSSIYVKPKAVFSFIRINRLYNHHDIYFNVKNGPIHLAIAPNGSGKTTIARFLLQFLNSACAGRYYKDKDKEDLTSNFIPVLDTAKTFCCSNILIGFKLSNQQCLCFAIYPVDSKSKQIETTNYHDMAMDAREFDVESGDLEMWQPPVSNKKRFDIEFIGCPFEV